MEMTTKRREQRHSVLCELTRVGRLSKPQIRKIIGDKYNADAWLADNEDLPFFETEAGMIKIIDKKNRAKRSPLIRDAIVHNLGGIHAVRG